MKKPPIPLQHLILIILFAWVFFFQGLGDYSLKEPDEGRYAEIPREMVATGDYTVPHLNYVRYFEKPVLFYWAVAGSYKAFGINEWSFRFPNALAAFCCVLLCWFFGRRWFGEAIGLLSSLILVSSFGFFGMARVVTLDMFLTLWLWCAILFFYGYYREKKPLFLYAFYSSLALATLTKGPVGVVLLGFTILIFLATERNLAFLKELRWIKGISLYLLITLPWFLLVSVKEKEFFYFFFIDQHILRFLTSKHKRTGSLFYFIPVLFGGMFPWSFLLPRAVVSFWRRKDLRLLMIWSAVVFLFFSVSKSKLPPYLLPIFPPLALVLGCFFHELWAQRLKKPLEMGIYAFLFLLVCVSVVLLYSGALPATLQKLLSGLSPDLAEILASLKGFAVGLALISAASAVLLLFRIFRTPSGLFSALAGFSLIFAAMLMNNLDVMDRLNTTKRLAQTYNEQRTDGSLLVNYGSFEESLPFYTKGRVTLVSYTGELEMGSLYPDARDFFLSEEQFLELFRSGRKVFVVVKASRLKRLREKGLMDFHMLASQNERYLISN
jgi:4-amino-4-deoxy-L-arabinose transferase-like glycosyltransferase